jgi:hypothetical protein
MLKEMSCDCAIVNAGVLRANLVYLPGTLKIKDILDILPMEDIVVSVLIKGSLLKEAIECGVSKYPALEGRFPQIAGLQFLMDPTKEPMDRIRDIRIGGKAMIPNKKYKLATTSYLCGGGDGYLPLKDHDEFICEIENGRILPTMVRQYLADLPGHSNLLQKKQSLASVRTDPQLQQKEKRASIVAIKSAFLPKISPVLDGRIIISKDLQALPRGRAGSVSSMSSDSTITMHQKPMIRRTSMAFPIPSRRTLHQLTDTQYSAEAREDSLAQTAEERDPSTRRVSVVTPQEEDDRASHAASDGHSSAISSCHDLRDLLVDDLPVPGHSHGSGHADKPGLLEACQKGDIATIQMHLDDARNSMSLVNKKGVGPIHDVQMLKRLGFGTNQKDVTTPLHYAVAFGQVGAVQLLLRHGANAKVKTAMGGDAKQLAFHHLAMAHFEGNAEMVSRLERITEELAHNEETMTEEMQYLLNQYE